MWEKITPKKFKDSLFQMTGISKKTVENHLKLYEGYVNKVNEIMEELKNVDLAKANQTYSLLRELKLELSFALGGVRNHEIYFDYLGGRGGEPKGETRMLIERNFGSYEDWRKDFRATGLSARGWVWLAYDWQKGNLFNYLGDSQNTYPIWECSVILALDTYEHAYWVDYGPDRAGYIEAFFANLDWEAIETRVRSLKLGGK